MDGWKIWLKTNCHVADCEVKLKEMTCDKMRRDEIVLFCASIYH